MKSLLITMVIIGVGVLLYSKCQTPNETRIVSILRDVTDTQSTSIETTSLTALFHLDSNQWSGAVFRYSTITDVSLNASLDKKLPTGNAFFSNEFERAKEVTAFTAFVNEALNKKPIEGKPLSSVYLAISRELIVLNSLQANEKILVVYGDLMENNLEVSMYDSKFFNDILVNQDSLKTYFESKLRLPSLKGITIYLLYQPQDPKADNKYQATSSFYKSLLEEKGAIVHIQANI